MTLESLESKQRNRYLLLRRLYEESRGSTRVSINFFDLAKKEGLSKEDALDICDYLLREGLIGDRRAGGGVSISHKGRKEIEQSISNPQWPAEDFPPTIVQNFNAPIYGGVQTGGRHNVQNNTISIDPSFDDAKEKSSEVTKLAKDKLDVVLQNDGSQDTSQPQIPVEVFCSYSHKDEEFREKLITHLSLLKRNNVITDWHDRQITAGAEWKNQIDEHLESASVILLLVSSDFLASDYCIDIEMKRAMERHAEGTACVIPIILRACKWSSAPFGKLQALPRNAKPVKSWDDEDEAFTDIAEGIEKAVAKLVP